MLVIKNPLGMLPSTFVNGILYNDKINKCYLCVQLTSFQKPDDKYVEDKTEKGPNYEQKRWEEEHLSAAVMHFGAKDAKAKRKVS